MGKIQTHFKTQLDRTKDLFKQAGSKLSPKKTEPKPAISAPVESKPQPAEHGKIEAANSLQLALERTEADPSHRHPTAPTPTQAALAEPSSVRLPTA